MKVAAIVQARMRSTRMPGKVLKSLSGRPLIGHTIDRLRACETVTHIAIVTSVRPEDNALVDFAHSQGVAVFRGDEDDVLGRYAMAVKALKPDVILRVTGDCPILSPSLIDSFVRQLTEQGADFLLSAPDFPCIQEGVDGLSARAFKVLMTTARDHPIAREHVSSYFKLYPDGIKIGRLDIDEAFRFRGARISVDTPADFAFLEALVDRLGPLGRIALEDVAALLKREPWLMTINAHIHQKAADQAGGTVLIRADGGGALGYGHLKRCLALAEALRDREGLGVVFQTGFHPQADEAAAADLVSESGFAALRAGGNADEAASIAEAMARTRAGAAVFDTRTDLPRSVLDGLRAQDVFIAVIDDGGARRLGADLAVYPPVPDIAGLGWDGFGGEILSGPDWTLLSPAITKRVKAPQAVRAAGESVLVTMGGSDPYRFTGPVATACAKLLAPEGATVRVLIGPGVGGREILARHLSGLPGVAVETATSNPEDILASATIAVAAFGVTAHELAALGVPALYICPTADHRRAAEAFAKLGAGAAIAGPGAVDADAVALQAAGLLRNGARRKAMSEAGPDAIDGRASERLARRIAEAVRARAAARSAPGAQAEARRANPPGSVA